MYRINEIKDLLRKHDYVPTVRRLGDGIIFTLPHPLLRRPQTDRLLEAYQIRRGKEAGLFYNSSLHPEEKFLGVPEYALRLFLMSDISACCQRVPIDDRLVCYLDAEGRDQPSLREIVDPPSSSEDRSKEGFLAEIFSHAAGEGFPDDIEQVALTHGVHEGYRLIRSFWRS